MKKSTETLCNSISIEDAECAINHACYMLSSNDIDLILNTSSQLYVIRYCISALRGNSTETLLSVTNRVLQTDVDFFKSVLERNYNDIALSYCTVERMLACLKRIAPELPIRLKAQLKKGLQDYSKIRNACNFETAIRTLDTLSPETLINCITYAVTQIRISRGISVESVVSTGELIDILKLPYRPQLELLNNGCLPTDVNGLLSDLRMRMHAEMIKSSGKPAVIDCLGPIWTDIIINLVVEDRAHVSASSIPELQSVLPALIDDANSSGDLQDFLNKLCEIVIDQHV